MIQTSKIASDELPLVNDLIKKSKLHWYPEDAYIIEAMKFIRIDSEWIAENEGLCLYEDSELVGFVGYSKYDDYWYLEHLWIDPKRIGKRYGTKALDMLKQMAKKAGAEKISLLPEPKAEGFYERNGATFSGLEVPSSCPGGPVFKEMIIKL